MNSELNQTANWTAYRRMASRLRTMPGLATLTVGLMLVELAGHLAGPWILGRATDALSSAHLSGGDLAGVASRWAGIFAASALLAALGRFLYGESRGRLVQGIVAGLRRESLEHLHRLSPAYFGANDTGAILARVSRDIQKMRPFFGPVLFSFLHLGLSLVGTFFVLAASSVGLALVTVGCFSVSLYLMLDTARRLQPLERAADDLYDAVSQDIKESVEGVKVVKAFGREAERVARFGLHMDAYVQGSLKAADLWTGRMPLAHAFFGLAVPLILVIGGHGVASGTLAKGTVVACLFYAGRIFRELNMLTRMVTMAQEAAVSAGRLFELLDSRMIVPEAGALAPFGRVAGSLRFEGVRFAYPDGGPVLRGVNLAVEPGERVALVGATGAGKSTLLALLLRFFDPEAGRILLDGTDIREMPLAALRRAVGAVFQESFLFSAPLRRNLAYARPDAGEAEILAAVRAAQLEGVVSAMPLGLDTPVGERGVTLSGGQRQRVAIARALLSSPAVLALDDATASVDAATERALVDALGAAASGRTTMVVTQRLSGVLLADRAVLLDGGVVSASGRHTDLYGACASYRSLFASQMLERT